LARVLDQRTRLGQIMDPAADKLLLLVSFLTAAARGAVPRWLAALVIGRDVVLASGGALFVAFPRALAVSFSGLYLAIFLVLWTLIGRGIAIEFRSHVADPLWRSAWDFVFTAASTLLAVFFGAAFGNLLRGVPLDSEGWFTLALFTDFTARDPVGILDWYTILTGVFALVALAAHGALFLAWKTDGTVRERSRRAARRLWIAVAALWPLVTVASQVVNPALFPAMGRRGLAVFAVVLAIGGIVTVFVRL